MDVYVVYVQNLKDPDKPWPQVWYGAPQDGSGKSLLDKPNSGIIQYHKVHELHRDWLTSDLRRAYPYKPKPP